MDKGTFGEWLKADGDFVEPGEAIFTLESEKALQEVESVDGGILKVIPGGPDEGDTVTVGTLIAYLLSDGEVIPTGSAAGSSEASSVVVTQVAERETSESTRVHSPRPSSAKSHRATVPRRNANGLPTISPRAARLANELGVDWSQLKSSGRTGRIRECDVQSAAKHPAPENRPANDPRIGTTRRVTAERMMASAHNTAPVTLTTRVDATNIVSLRQQYKASGNQSVPAFHDIIAKLTAITLSEYPAISSQWTDDGVVQSDGIHIGLAVDSEAGLLVPVVRNVDRLSLLDLAEYSRNLIERARQRA